MKQLEPIVIPLTSTDQLVEPCSPTPFCRRGLKEEAEQFLIKRVNALPRYTVVRLLITLPLPDVAKEKMSSNRFMSISISGELRLKQN